MGRVIITLLVLTSLQSFAASDTSLHLQLIKTIAGSYTNFYADNLQNIYLISTATSQIKKLSNNGDSVAVFNNTARYGKVYSMDVSNPLKILVYYKDFTTIVLLDRFLTTRATIDLRRLGITQVKTIALSYDGNIWLYDEQEGKLKKIDENSNLLTESADLRLVFNDSLNPVNLIDNNGQLYLYDNRAGWLIFDSYTAFKKQLAFGNWKDASAADERLTGRDSNFVYARQGDIDYHTVKANISLADIIKTQWQGSILYLLDKDGVKLYQALQ